MHDTHGHNHGHHHHHDVSTQPAHVLLFSVLILVVFMVVQIIGGFLFNSLALLSDSVHMFSDVGALLLAFMAAKIALRPATSSRTYGYGKVELLAGLFNGVTLIAASIWILIEAIKRMGDAPEVNGMGVVIVATAGLVANLIVAWLLARATISQDNVNMRAAMQHALVDAASSAAVIVNGVIIYWVEMYVIDAILSIMIGIIAAYGGYRVVVRSIHLLIDGSPQAVSADDVISSLRSHAMVSEVHDVHVWHMGSAKNAVTAHVRVTPETDISMAVDVLNKTLAEQLPVHHITLQVTHDMTTQPVSLQKRLHRPL